MPWTLPDDCVLGIFRAKPEPGILKTPREWGPDAAAEHYDAMLFDTLDLWDSEEVLSPEGVESWSTLPTMPGPGSMNGFPIPSRCSLKCTETSAVGFTPSSPANWRMGPIASS